MKSINFIKTPNPAMHTSLRRWYILSITAFIMLLGTITWLQTNQIKQLRAARQERDQLAPLKKQWDALFAQEAALHARKKQLQEYSSLVQAIGAKQQQIISYLASLKKTVSDSSASLLSLALSQGKGITVTAQCSCPNGACALSNSLAQTPEIENLKLAALTPTTVQGKELYVVTMKGLVK